MGGAATLAACGAPAAPDDGPETKATGPVTLAYWDWAKVWEGLVTDLSEAFMARNANVTIKPEIVPGYWTKLQVAIAGDAAPDSWRMNGPNLPQWASQGLMQDITAYVARDKGAAASLQAMAPVIASYTKRGGKQWTMPFGQAISGIIAYNDTMLTAEGLQAPAELGAKWTWAMLAEYAVKLTRRDGSRHGYYADRGAEVGWLPFLYANGGALFDKEGKRAAINSPEGRQTLEYFVDLSVRQRVTPLPQDIQQESAVDRFLGGRLAMLPQGSWQIKDLNIKAESLRWDLVPVPLAPRTHKNGSTNQMASIAMSKTAASKAAVWEWQKFIGAKEGQDLIAQAQFFPARMDSAERIYYRLELGPPHRPLLRDVLKVTQALPWLDVAGNTSGWNPIVNPLIGQILDGQVSVKDGLQQMEQELNAGIEVGFR